MERSDQEVQYCQNTGSERGGPGPRMPLSGVSVGKAEWEAGEVSLVYWQQ